MLSDNPKPCSNSANSHTHKASSPLTLPPMASQLLKRSIPLKPVINRSLLLTSTTSDADPNDIVSSVVSIITNHRSKSRWSAILASCPQGLTPLQVSQILLQIRSNVHLACSFFRFTTENALTTHDLQSLSTMIHIVARARNRSRAETLICTAIQSCDPASTAAGDVEEDEKPRLFRALVESYRSCDSAPLVFDLLIQAYLKFNRINTCLRIVKLLESSGFKLDIKTCNALVAKVANVRGVDSGYDLYLDLFGVDGNDDNRIAKHHQPNLSTFNVLLAACYRDRRVDKAEEIWREMRLFKRDPNPKSYNTLMAAYWDNDEVEKACELWEEMKSQGLKFNIVTYNTMIVGCCKIGKVSVGEEFYRKMVMAGTKGNSVTHTNLIMGHCRDSVGDVHAAYSHFKEMCRKEFRLDVVTVDLLVRKLCMEGMVNEGLQVLTHLTKDPNSVALRSSYDFLIKGLCENGEMEEALKIQAAMVGKGFNPSADNYAAFVDGYTKLGQIDMAVKLREEMNQSVCLKGGELDDKAMWTPNLGLLVK